MDVSAFYVELIAAAFIVKDLNTSPRRNVSFLAEPGWLFPERGYLERIPPDIPAG